MTHILLPPAFFICFSYFLLNLVCFFLLNSLSFFPHFLFKILLFDRRSFLFPFLTVNYWLLRVWTSQWHWWIHSDPRSNVARTSKGKCLEGVLRRCLQDIKHDRTKTTELFFCFKKDIVGNMIKHVKVLGQSLNELVILFSNTVFTLNLEILY